MFTDQPPPYPFDEFSKHYDEVALAVYEDGSADFVKTAAFVTDYMNERYEASEAAYKTIRFILIMEYVASHLKDFDQGDYAVIGSPTVGALVKDHLLRAVHHYFLEKPLNELHDPTPAEIMEIADRFRE